MSRPGGNHYDGLGSVTELTDADGLLAAIFLGLAVLLLATT